jgi:uncharacterized protein YqgV (UPF0045/DUF77 family)
VVLLEFSMTPMTKGESVSAYVARSLDIVLHSSDQSAHVNLHIVPLQTWA